MINEAILTKIKRRKHLEKLSYIKHRNMICLRQNIRNIIKRTRDIALNMLRPRDFDERMVFDCKDRNYIKRCEWWHFDKQDIKYIMKTNIIKSSRLDYKSIMIALQLIKNWEKILDVARMYRVSTTYFYYFINNPDRLYEKM